MAGEKPLPPEQQKAIQGAMKALVKRYDDNQTRAAEALGISQGHVSAVIAAKRGVGIDTVMKLARELEQSTDIVLGLQEDADDPALQLALAREAWPEWVRAAAISKRHLHGTISTEEWITWMRSLQTTDAVISSNQSAQEKDFERKRAAAKKKTKKRAPEAR